MSKLSLHIISASRFVFSSRVYVALGVLVFAVFFVLYTFVLPATYTGGRVGFVSLQYLSVRLGIFAFLFSILLAFIIPFAVYVFCKKRGAANSAPAPHRIEDSGAGSAAGSFFGSILPPLLCCSPLLPTLAAFAGGVFPFAFRASGVIQGVMATYETQIFTAIVVILAYSVWQNAKRVIAAESQTCDC